MLMSLAELSQITGLPKPTIESWEKIGAISSKKTEGGHRRYDSTTFERLQQQAHSMNIYYLRGQFFHNVPITATEFNQLWLFFMRNPLKESHPNVKYSANNIIPLRELTAEEKKRQLRLCSKLTKIMQTRLI